MTPITTSFWDTLLATRIRNFPAPMKAIVAGYLLCIAVGYSYALINVVLVVGVRPTQIADHYAGSAQTIKTESQVKESGREKELSFDEDPIQDQAPKTPAPSMRKIVGEGHTHLFGMASFFFPITLFGLFTAYSRRTKTLLMILPYAAILFDHMSFVIVRTLGRGFTSLIILSGSLLAISFAALAVGIFYELILLEQRKKR